MSDHFTLDVDPELLRAAAKDLSRLGEHLSEKGRTTKHTPGAIGDEWTGDAATTVKAEMTGLGEHMTGFTKDLETSAEALRSLAKDYEESQRQVVGLNKRWQAAEDAYQDAVDKADRSYEHTRDHGGPDGKPLPGGLRHEIQTSREYAYSQASDDRQTTQHNLEYSFGMMKQWLAQQTRNAGSALVDAAPLAVTAEQVAAWSGSGAYPTRLRRDDLLSTLDLAAAREKQELEELDRQRREDAQEDAQDDIEDLQELLDDYPADPEALRDKLAEIGERSSDDYYAEALVRELGADGLNDLYDDVSRALPTYYEVEEVWPGLQKFNDTIANGLAQLDDTDLAGFVDGFMDNDQGPKRWAFIADSELADGRVNAVAIAHYTDIYTTDNTHMGFDPFTSMFNLAFGDDDKLEQFEANSSAADFADVLSGGTAEQRERLVQALMWIGNPQMNEDEWEVKARLFGETLQTLVDREKPDEVELLLENMHRPYDVFYQEKLLPYVEQALNDPKAMTWVIQEVRYGQMDADVLTDAMRRVDVDVDQLVADMIDYEVRTGVDQSRLAKDIGYLLGTGDLLGDSISPDGVIKSLVESAISAGVKNPLTAPVMGVFNALLSEVQRMEANEEAWADGWEHEEPQRLLAFLIYQKANGEPPEFKEWLVQNGRQDDPDAIIDFLQEQEDQNTELFRDLDGLRDDIDEARDEE